MRLPTRLLRRDPDSHKGDFGHVLVIAGSLRYSGAAVLTAAAVMRSGAGLVTMAVPEKIAAALIRIKTPETMIFALPNTKEGSLSLAAWPKIKALCKRVSVTVIGPGLSQNVSTMALVRKAVKLLPVPLLIDADGLNALGADPRCLKRRNATVVTPHPGEMARLLGTSVSRVQKNRKTIAKDFATKYNVEVVLKGDHTVVAGSGGKVYVNPTGNAGMATAGSGDVLSGMIAALMSQGLEAFEACKFGVYLHGLAGDLAASEKTQPGMIASDIIENIPRAFKKCS